MKFFAFCMLVSFASFGATLPTFVKRNTSIKWKVTRIQVKAVPTTREIHGESGSFKGMVRVASASRTLTPW